MNLREYLGKQLLFFDGAMGSLLQKRGLDPSVLPESWNLERKDVIVNIHLDYLNSGANILKTNTFGANRLKFKDKNKVREIIEAATENAHEAISKADSVGPHFVALDIGPTGKLLKPFGELEFEEAVSIFADMVNAGKNNADCILIETMNDLYETKAAVIAAKENSDLPIFVTNAYGLSGKLMTGATPEAVCVTLEGLGVDAIGINCSFGPKEMLPVVKNITEVCSVPVIVNPNAGLPDFSNGETSYDIDENEFSDCMKEILKLGVHLIGGCCGTSPSYIKALYDSFKNYPVSTPSDKNLSAVSSYNNVVYFKENPVIIGERINPKEDKSLEDALKKCDTEYAVDLGLDQEDDGAHILAVNVGNMETSEKEVMVNTVKALQEVTGLPLRIDTADISAMEAAMRIYNGKPMINFVNENEEITEEIFVLMKKYGALMVALAVDENDNTSETSGISEFARKIYECAKKYGVLRKDVIISSVASDLDADFMKSYKICDDFPDMVGKI